MKTGYIFVSLALLAILAQPGAAQTETFRSQETGLSFDYPVDMTINIDVSDPEGVIKLSGPEGISVIFSSIKSSSATLDSMVDWFEEVYSEAFLSFQTLSTTTKSVQGSDGCVVKEYLMEVEGDEYITSLQMRIMYIQGDDRVYTATFLSTESFYDRADQLYFTDILDSIRIYPVDETLETNLPGFPKMTSEAIWSSPALADLDGDGSLEIIVGTNENKLHIWKVDGRELSGFPVSAENIIRSSPAVGDLDGDGLLDIAVGSDDGKLYAWSSKGKALPGFPKVTEGSIVSSPALGDLDGDSRIDIVVGSWDTGIYAWKGDGSLICGYPIITGSSAVGGIWSSPAIGDLDGDGGLDVAIGISRYESGLSKLLDSIVSEGRVFALKGSDGSALENFPYNMPFNSLIGYSSPVLGDLDGDGRLDIILGVTDGIYALSLEGEDLDGFPVETGGSLQDSFLALGDVDGDGSLEIAAGARDGRLYLIRSDGSSYPGYPIQTGGCIRHVILGDIDGDGQQEILGGSTDNRVHAWKLDGSEVWGFPKVTMGDIGTSVAMVDLEGDGTLELVATSYDGALYVWQISSSFGSMAWPMFRQNLENTGVAH